MSDIAIDCHELRRVYESRTPRGRTSHVAVASVSLAVQRGEVFGLLGPNGAGKTTTVRMLSTLLTPTSGSASVCGFDVVTQDRHVRTRIGLILGGERGLYGRLSGLDNLRYFGALNRMPPGVARARAMELLGLVGLADHGDRLAETYSRGMRQRLHIARGLMTDPEVLFMDEPTIGLDPVGAREIRDLVPRLVQEGKTVFLTTHYMFEADQLCNRIAIINRGELVAEGTPSDIKRSFSNVRILELTLQGTRDGLVDGLGRLPGVRRIDRSVDGIFERLTLHVEPSARPHAAIAQVVGAEAAAALMDREPTLEEAYLSILR